MTTTEFPIGARIVLVDLTKAPQYNGKVGVVKSPVKDGRQHVFVSDLSKTMALRTSNMTYQPRAVESLSVRELKAVIRSKEITDNVAGMDISELRNIVSSNTDTPMEIAEILARPTSRPAAPDAGSMSHEDFKSQADAVSQMSPAQLRQQAQAMRAMDPSLVRRMNPQLAGMSDEQIRAAANQMEAMAANPSMFEIAKQQMKKMTPDELNDHLKSKSMPSPTEMQEQLGNLSPEQLKQQAAAMKNMHPDTLRRMNPQLAGMTNEQIKAASAQMETMADNPQMLDMMRDQIKGMSTEDLEKLRQQQQGLSHVDPSKMMQNMGSGQMKDMLKAMKKNPELMKQALRSNPATANMSDEQMQKSLNMFSEMDDEQLERTMNMVNKFQKVTQPVTTAWTKMNNLVGGQLAKILLLVVVGMLGCLAWGFVSSKGATVGLAGPDSFAQQAPKNMQESVAQDEFGGEF